VSDVPMNSPMRDPVRVIVLVVVLVVVAGGIRSGRSHTAVPRYQPRAPVAGADYRLDAETARRVGARFLSEDLRRATFRFDGVAPLDRQVFLSAVAAARPEAQRLIGLVDGLVSVSVGPTGPMSLGATAPYDGAYAMRIDLATVTARLGQPGVDRVVLHELGHVVDFALLPDALTTALDGGIPRGWGCEYGKLGSCASREERFAESFAKWATGDIGVNIDVGYKVPPPGPTLDAWGAPLARFGL
jgi:hypothetical protein